MTSKRERPYLGGREGVYVCVSEREWDPSSGVGCGRGTTRVEASRTTQHTDKRLSQPGRPFHCSRRGERLRVSLSLSLGPSLSL